MFSSETRIYDGLYKIAGKKLLKKLGDSDKYLELDNLNYQTYLELPEEIKEKIDLVLNRLITKPVDKKFKNKLNKLGVEIKNLEEFKEFGNSLDELEDKKINKDSLVSSFKNGFKKGKDRAKKGLDKSKPVVKKGFGFTKRVFSNLDKFVSKGGFKKLLTLLKAAGITVGVGFVKHVLTRLGVPITNGWFLALGLLSGTIALTQVGGIIRIITEIHKENKKNKSKVESLDDIETKVFEVEKEDTKEISKSEEVTKEVEIEDYKPKFKLPSKDKKDEEIVEIDDIKEDTVEVVEEYKPKFSLPSSKNIKDEVVENDFLDEKEEDEEVVLKPEILDRRGNIISELEKNISKYDVAEEEILNCERTIEKSNNVINAYRKYYNPNMCQNDLMKISAYKSAYMEREYAIKQVEIYKKRHDYATTAKSLSNNLKNSSERLNRDSISEREIITNTGEKKTLYIVNQVREPLERIVYDDKVLRK